MSRYRIFPAGEGQRFLDAIAVERGYPRCHCPKHDPVAEHTGGVGASCTCTAATGMGVDLACPHVTTAHSQIMTHPTSGQEAIKIRGLDDLDGTRVDIRGTEVVITASGAVERLPAGWNP